MISGMKIVILAGGKGTRIASVASEIPKALIPVCGIPVLEHQVIMARDQGFREFVFVIGHLGNQIKEYFGSGEKWGVSIEYFEESAPLGTAGALAYLKDSLSDDFFVFYGDTVMDIDMRSMLSFHRQHHGDATLLLHPNDHPHDSDLVEIDNDCQVVKFLNKPHPEDLVARNIVNAALFLLSPGILAEIPEGKKSHLEKDILAPALEKGYRVTGYLTAEYIKDMGTPERYEHVCRDVADGRVKRMNRHNPRPAIFLDRDGVVSEEVNLLCDADKLRLIPGAAEAIRMINRSGYLAVLVTNQPVIARNLCSIEELEHIHAWLETILGRERAYLNAIYYCPHHPDKGYPEERPEYKIECDCRKPKPGMLLRAAKDWNIDLTESVMIGDRESDVLAGRNAGCKESILINTNEPGALLQAVKNIFKS